MTCGRDWGSLAPEDRVTVDLPHEQRYLMIRALMQWGGAARPTDTLARAMGFANDEAIHREGRRIWLALAEHEPMSKSDWARALVATEFVFASSYYGAALDWEAVTDWGDEQTLSLLRALQRSLVGLRAPFRLDEGLERDALADL